jgi:DNA invertase Pin-like site-specific DNA recombinase
MLAIAAELPRSAADDPTARPRMVGYLRLPEQASDMVMIDWCQSMRRYADQNGYELVNVFYEGDSGSGQSFYAMLKELEATRTVDVVVPSLDRLHSHPALLELRMRALLGTANAELHIADG